MKYRKKPVVIEAYQYKGNMFSINGDMDAPKWIEDAFHDATLVCIPVEGVLCLYILTLEGRMKVSEGDYIINGVHGEIYSCKPDIFEETYELAEEEK